MAMFEADIRGAASAGRLLRQSGFQVSELPGGVVIATADADSAAAAEERIRAIIGEEPTIAVRSDGGRAPGSQGSQGSST